MWSTLVSRGLYVTFGDVEVPVSCCKVGPKLRFRHVHELHGGRRYPVYILYIPGTLVSTFTREGSVALLISVVEPMAGRRTHRMIKMSLCRTTLLELCIV